MVCKYFLLRIPQFSGKIVKKKKEKMAMPKRYALQVNNIKQVNGNQLKLTTSLQFECFIPNILIDY